MTAIWAGTDLHIYNWDEWSQNNQTTYDHWSRICQNIVELGSEVQGYEIGQRVSAEGHITCGVCRIVVPERPHLCPKHCWHCVNRDGAFAEFISVPAKNLWPVHKDISSGIRHSSIPMETLLIVHWNLMSLVKMF